MNHITSKRRHKVQKLPGLNYSHSSKSSEMAEDVEVGGIEGEVDGQHRGVSDYWEI